MGKDDKTARRLVVIDGKSVFYRAFYAMSNLRLPRGEDGKEGESIGGVYGFAAMLLEIHTRFQPDLWAVAWDKSHTNIRRRREIYAEYKANRRKAPDEFYAQLPYLDELFQAYHIPKYEFDDYEADDIMGTFAKLASSELEVDLISSDLDMLQVLYPNVRFFALKTGLSNIEEFDEKAFERKFGVLADQFLDWKALKGDSSDNIPGVAGIGPKTAAELLSSYDTLDNIYVVLDKGDSGDKLLEKARAKLIAGKKDAYISRELGELQCDAPVKITKATEKDMAAEFDAEKLSEIFQKFGFRSLSKKLGELGVISASLSEESSSELDHGKPNTNEATIKDGLLVSSDIKQWLHEQDEAVVEKTLAEFADKKLFPFDLGVANFLLDEHEADFAKLQQGFNSHPRIKWVAANLDFPLIPVLYKMEKIGMKIDKKRLAKISADFTEEAKKLEQEVMALVGEQFNLNSPKQLSEVLFDKLKLSTDKIRKNQKAYSTGRAELAKLRDLHPAIGLIEKYRVVQKLLSTYADALPAQADENNRVHTTLSQTTTSTGRLASSNPNLQNIPTRTELGRQIRTAFVAEDGNVLVEADYSQFELRIAAALSGEQSLIDAFNSGEDAHQRTASQVFNVPAHEVSKAQRNAAKTINFGVLYGISATGLAEATKMTRPEALAFINRYFATHPKLDAFMKNTLAVARKTGYAETWLGRRHYFTDLHTPNFSRRQAAERAAINMPIQGTEADLMKLAMIRLDAVLARKFPDVHLIMQVHDSLLVEAPEGVAKEVAKIMQEIMEGVAPRLPVKLATDIRIVKNWGE
ncbi:DNA polymerase [Candidatus Saccharibacteria bacterium]|nr:DNA polymerase [Candidatus Saccharibacteria bacterium]